ncbi:MAG: RNA polymerase sigma factor [Phycisphaerales bacterium]|jgi:RNA polymerase sigma-70 factor (ECF subfamily)
MTAESKKNEPALVCAAQRGDKEAMQLLLRRNWTWLKGLVYSTLRDTKDIDDVLQDICVRVIRKIDSLRQPERFRPWLAVLARRMAIRHSRKKTQRTILLNEEIAEHKADEKATRILENLEQQEQYQQILDAIKLLPEKYRQVFVLGHIDELTYQKIAEILDIPLTTVQIRLVRARRMIYKQVTGKDKNKVRK